ncbi:uncharacterized protein LOC144745059 [Ciona intestinalis]
MIKMFVMKQWLLLVILPTTVLCTTFNIITMLFDDVTNEVNGIRNCTGCLFGTLDCANEAVLNALCTCEDLTREQITTQTETALNNQTISWYYSDATIICCLETSHISGKDVLASLLDYSYGEQFTIKLCHNLNPLLSAIAMYGVREISVTSDTNSNYPLQNIYMSDTDLSGKTLEYRKHHIVLVQSNIFDGENELKSWSTTEEIDNDDLNSKTSTALVRAPSEVREKEDGKFMLTPIYV